MKKVILFVVFSIFLLRIPAEVLGIPVQFQSASFDADKICHAYVEYLVHDEEFPNSWKPERKLQRGDGRKYVVYGKMIANNEYKYVAITKPYYKETVDGFAEYHDIYYAVGEVICDFPLRFN